MKIGSHFTLDGERWQVLGHSPNFVSAINSAGKRRRFGREQLAERLRVAFVNLTRTRGRGQREAVPAQGLCSCDVNLRQPAGGAAAEKAKPAWEENLERLVNRCIAKCGVSRERIERLAKEIGLPIRTVAMELLAQKKELLAQKNGG